MPPLIPEPHWTQVLSALLTPIIAVLAILIAYWQWRTAQNKLKYDLFDRRFAVYDAARKLIASIVTTGQTGEQELYKFLAGTRETKWLLNEEIDGYFQNEIWKQAIKLQTLEKVLEGLPADQRLENVARQSEIKEWIIQQYNVLDDKFTPFLNLKH